MTHSPSHILPWRDASRERYRELFDANPLPTWAYCRETLRFLEVNQAAIDHYGYSRREFLAMTIADIRPQEEVPALLTHLGQPRLTSTVATWRHRTRNGRLISVALRGRELSFDGVPARLVVAYDMTAQLEAEAEVRSLDAQLQQAQKMEAIGRLAGGIAHDFNNILTAVLAYTGFVTEALSPDDPLRQDTGEIEKATRRGAELTRQLLTFCRKHAAEPTVLDVDVVVATLEPMLRRLIGEDVRIALRSDGAAHTVKIDRVQLEQVLLNLAVNARDAMPSGGELRIETERMGAGDVALRVTDTGRGMDAATCARIFEPFFTTKEPGRGTGLGLSTVYGIVRRSGGSVAVHSAPERGATFEIRLPFAFGPALEAMVPPCRTASAPRAVVLVVDDDDMVRAAVARALAGTHEVLEAATVDEARAVSAGRDGPIDLLITDVVMPSTSGVQLAAELAGHRPALKVLYMSGYSDHPSVQDGIRPGMRLVEKPFAPVDLVRHVDDMLRAEGSP